MEYLVVKFETSRRVRINDNPFGFTNTVIQIEAGTHTVTLEAPPDFSPLAQTVLIENTSPLGPLIVTFHRLPASAIPPAPGTRT
jgi:hypothetical protein